MPVKLRYHLIASIAISLLFALFVCGQPSPLSAERISSKADEYMKAATRAENFSGSILIAGDGKLIISKGYGMASYEFDVPNTPNTIFQIASLTKAFTALAVIQLRDNNKLKLGDSICQYLDKCPSAWQPITIRNLLTHTSGIPNYTTFQDYEKTAPQFVTNEEIVTRFRDKPLESVPGEEYKYNNSGYHLLGMIIEKASGKSYGDYLRENIFVPLGMKNTFSDSSRKIIKRRAAGYALNDDLPINAAAMDLTNIFSEGGICSTTEDLLIWDQALYTEKLLSRKSLDETFTPFKNGYGYGWNITRLFDRKEIKHSGRNFGFSTHIKRFPDDKMTVIVLGNNQMTDAEQIAVDLAAIVFGEAYRVPREAKDIAPPILKKHVGIYEISTAETVTITLENGKLFAQGTGQGKVPIFALSEIRFFLKNADVEISFNQDVKGITRSLSLWKDGRETITYKKL